MVVTNSSSFVEFQAALQRDQDYANVWHDNIACQAFNEGVVYATANRIATNVMRSFFNIETKSPDERSGRSPAAAANADRMAPLFRVPRGHMASLVDSVVGCVRCGGDHEDMHFYPLDNAADYTHWAMCPIKNQPLLRLGAAPVLHVLNFPICSQEDRDGDVIPEEALRVAAEMHRGTMIFSQRREDLQIPDHQENTSPVPGPTPLSISHGFVPSSFQVVDDIEACNDSGGAASLHNPFAPEAKHTKLDDLP